MPPRIWPPNPDFKSGVPEFNKLAFDIYYSHKDAIAVELQPHIIDWRNNETTAVIEIKIDGLGYRTERSEAAIMELAKTAARMADVAKKYIPEIKEKAGVAGI